MEIHELDTHFLQVSQGITVGELIKLLDAFPDTVRARWYVVVRLNTPGKQIVPAAGSGFEVIAVSPGYAVLLPMADLASIVAIGKPEQRDRSLDDCPDLLHPALTVERIAMGAGRARRDWLPRSPNRRLVIQEAGQVIGLLTDEMRAGMFGGVMTHLFGSERPRTSVAKGRITYRCPNCPAGQNIYDFADLIDLATNRLICPNGHIIEEQKTGE